jgi:hypothetical protein
MATFALVNKINGFYNLHSTSLNKVRKLKAPDKNGLDL